MNTPELKTSTKLKKTRIHSFFAVGKEEYKNIDLNELDVDHVNPQLLYSPQQKYKSNVVKKELKDSEVDKLIKDLTEGSPNQKYYSNILGPDFTSLMCKQIDFKGKEAPIELELPNNLGLCSPSMGVKEFEGEAKSYNNIAVMASKKVSNMVQPTIKLEKAMRPLPIKQATASDSNLAKVEFLTSVPQRNGSKKLSQCTTISNATKSTNWVEIPEEIDPSILTNRQEIPDFYEYIEECLKVVNKLKQPSMEEIKHLLVDVPIGIDDIGKKVAVFDLDETLVHCVVDKNEPSDVRLKISLPYGKKTEIGINVRPLIQEALNEISKDYFCVAYTASEKCYADRVLDHIDPDLTLFKFRLYRHNCVKVEHEGKPLYIKDLRVFRNVDLKDLIIIDNSVLSFAFHLDNGIPILPYYEGSSDSEMRFLAKYLKHLSTVVDLRTENSKLMQLDFWMKKIEERRSNNESESKYSLSFQMEEECNAKSTQYCEEIFSENVVVFTEETPGGAKSNLGGNFTNRGSGSYNNFTPRTSSLSFDKSTSYVKDDINYVWNELRNIFK